MYANNKLQMLTLEQSKTLDILRNNSGNVLITGWAGSGKSFLLREFVRNTGGKSVVVLATTGVAALNVDWETIHRFFDLENDTTLEKIPSLSKEKTKILERLDTIVIDEISMARADMIQIIDKMLRSSLDNDLPFGSKQMVFIWDPFQLPPVVSEKEAPMFEEVYRSAYFFDAPAYCEGNFLKIELTENKRQSDDAEFFNILNRLRKGVRKSEDMERLNQRIVSEPVENAVIVTVTNNDVDVINKSRLEALSGEIATYIWNVDGNFKKGDFPTELSLGLKKGARIMFVKNDKNGRWVNGSTWTVMKMSEKYVTISLDQWETHDVYAETWVKTEPYYDKKSKTILHRTLWSFTQLPIKLAWAITIHKSQGKTFERVAVDMKWYVNPWQAYVALSRCKSMDGLFLMRELKAYVIRTDDAVTRFANEGRGDLEEQAEKEKMRILRESVAQRWKIRFEYENSKTGERDLYAGFFVQEVGAMEWNGRKFEGVRAEKGVKSMTFSLKKMRKISLEITT